jgi:hypothetical protein
MTDQFHVIPQLKLVPAAAEASEAGSQAFRNEAGDTLWASPCRPTKTQADEANAT